MSKFTLFIELGSQHMRVHFVVVDRLAGLVFVATSLIDIFHKNMSDETPNCTYAATTSRYHLETYITFELIGSTTERVYIQLWIC